MTAGNEAHGISKQAIMEFFDRLAPHWDDGLMVDEAKINAILDAAGVGPGSHVLDVACGTGVLFPFYAQRNAAKVTGVDISPEMVKIALRKIEGPRFEALCADIETLPVAQKYDCCVVYNAFPHFPEPARLIERLSAWLKPGGRLTVAHGMSLEVLNRHHAGSAAEVSRGLIPAPEMAALFSGRFRVDRAVSDEEKYIVSGILPPTEEDDGA